MLGIIIGISSVIALVGLGQGSKKAMTKEFENTGVNRAYVYLNEGMEGDSNGMVTDEDMITHNDMNIIERVYGSKLEGVSPVLSLGGSMNQGRVTYNINISGVTEKYNKIENIKMASGRFLSGEDVVNERNVAVIEQKMAEKFFKGEDPVGKMITMDTGDQSQTYRVVGTFTKPKALLTMGASNKNTFDIYTPYTQVERITGENTFSYLDINVKEGENIKRTVKGIVNIIERKHGSVGKNIYMMSTAESQLKMVNNVTGNLTKFISAIAAISLLVGGIGIMNIMLVSVTERTREIGIRKALGANKKDILRQFMIEAIIVSGCGGIIGISLGIGFSYLGALVIKIQPSISLTIVLGAFLFSAMIGVFFGLYPANKAAKLNTIDALRYE